MATEHPSVDEIFGQAVRRAPGEERSAYLDTACGADSELRQRVERLLQAHGEAGSFLESPAGGPPRTIDQPITAKPGTVIGPYKLLQQIGEGGFGVVYMADQTEPVKRRVALKIIKPGMDTKQVIARFEAERQALAMMDHPNIAKVFDAGATESGRPYFVMELVKGVSITQFCDEKQLTPRERLELFIPVCQALQHAHQKGVIHRDIKPSNVMVAKYDDRATPKIIDFGVAKAVDQRLTEKTMFTQLGQVIGAIDYMSPEQAQLNQLDIDTRSDIYSLGVLLYELLTGETPLDRERLRSAAFDEMLRIIREEDPPKPSLRLGSSETLPSIAANRRIEPKRLSSLVRGELDWIVMKALEKDRTRRYETATSFSADIQRYLSDEPVQACPPSTVYRLKKFARRNKGLLSTVTLVAVALLVGTGVSVWQAVAAHAAKNEVAERYQAEVLVRTQLAEEVAAKQRAIEKARDHLSRAIQAVDEMYTDVATAWIADDIALSATQVAFVEKAIAFYDDILANPQDYYAGEPQLAEAALRSGMLQFELKQYGDALARFNEGLRILEHSENKVQLSEEMQLQRAKLLNAASVCCSTLGDNEAARDQVRRAIDRLDGLIADFQQNTEYREYRAVVLHSLSALELDCGNPDIAEEHVREAIAIHDDSGRLDGDTIAFHNTLALCLMGQNRLDEALTLQRKWLTNCEQKLRDRGDSAGLRQIELLLLQGLVQSLFLQEKYQEADEMGSRWIDRLVRSTASGTDPARYYIRNFIDPSTYPSNDQPEKFSQWLNAMILVAKTRAALGRPLEAELMLGHAIRVASILRGIFPTNLRHRVDLANVYAHLALVLRPRFPKEATGHALMAAKTWIETLDEFEHAAQYSSPAGPPRNNWYQSDFEWFVGQFPEYDIRNEDHYERVVRDSKQTISSV